MCDPALGRFIQPDSIIPDPASSKGFDRYAYVNNNPINFNDPSGHSQACDSYWEGDACGDDGTVAYIVDKYKKIKESGSTDYWRALSKTEQAALAKGGYTEGVWEDAIVYNGVGNAAGSVYDPVMWAAALLPGAKAAQIAVKGIQGAIAAGSSAGTAATVGAVTNAASTSGKASSDVVTVIGKYPANMDLANKIGGNYLNISMNVWNSMTPEAQ